MIKDTNDPELRAYVEKEKLKRRHEAEKGIGQYITPENPGSAAGRNLIHEDLKSINKELHTIAQELKNLNKTLSRRR